MKFFKQNFGTIVCGALFLLIFFTKQAGAQKEVTVKGKIIGRESKSMFVIPRTVSDRSKDKPVIKILNNEFSYTFKPNNLEAYEMVFEDEYNNGAWRPIVFFPDTTVVEMTLYSMDDAEKNRILGGRLNRMYFDYVDKERERYRTKKDFLAKQTQILNEAGRYRSKAHDDLMRKLGKAKDQAEKLPLYQEREELQKMGKDLTPEGLLIRNAYDR